MTREEINTFLANTKVYVAGKSKEIQEKLFSIGYKWYKGDTDVIFTEYPFLYIDTNHHISYGRDMCTFTEQENREITVEEILSLELTEPAYRPFKTQEECWQEMIKHQPFGWIKPKIGGSFVQLGFIHQLFGRVVASWTINDKERFDTSDVYENYTFADGTPFGIKED